ncbi:MAG TPA: hypothetical protein H9716_05655 [Candidatus Enterocloster faecavium]|uniref:Uncharacterized protein n=1 Tax=Candidatus Enterocloster faecavium TaxID=2838560 RepID=A0A9D2L7J9_9FIRM|nr:hypothetical protein [Candidatus Enterocloster faecavium]
MMEQQRFDVETKRVLLAGLQQSGYSLEEALPEILEELKRLGGPSSSPKLYAKTAAQFILAYLELGFSYLRHRELFDPILEWAGLDSLSLPAFWRCNPFIPLKKSPVRSMFRKWPASPHNSHTIIQAVEDVLRRVSTGDVGCYQYYTARRDGTFTSLYQLNVYEDYAIFHDVMENRYYTLSAGPVRLPLNLPLS